MDFTFKGPVENGLTTTEKILWNLGVQLQMLNEAQGGPIPNPLPVTFSGGEETPSSTTIAAVGPGTIAAGAKSLVLITDTKFSGTLMGDSYSGEQTIPLNASLGSTLAAVDYDLISGTLKVIRIQ